MISILALANNVEWRRSPKVAPVLFAHAMCNVQQVTKWLNKVTFSLEQRYSLIPKKNEQRRVLLLGLQCAQLSIFFTNPFTACVFKRPRYASAAALSSNIPTITLNNFLLF